MDDKSTQILEMPTPTISVIGPEQILKLTQILQKYKSGKAHTEHRIIASENWWKLRNEMEESQSHIINGSSGFVSASGWLHNCLANKHADMTNAYPEANLLPREQADKPEAAILSAIIPCILEQNEFEETYSEAMWQKVKTGTGAYKIVWDANKLNGLGDISISRVNLLNIYWEPGITDIQKSRYFFHTELMDNDLLEEEYPELQGKLTGQTFLSAKFLYDDNVSTDGKSTVIECYYHKNGKLHYVKYVNDNVLFASENDPEMSRRGFYDHGKYPFVFDALYPVEGTPCGYGFIDLCKNPQMAIDMLNTSFIKNAMAGAQPRFFKRQDGSINVDEFLDLNKPLVNVDGMLGEDSIRQIEFKSLDGIYVTLRDGLVNELRETSGNTETATGSTSGGVTAAAAIAALQEASGKTSKDAILTSYRSFTKIVNICIELIRQFYDMPRQFRIVGQYGFEQFVTYSNQGLQPKPQGNAFGVDMGYRLPVFDIKVSAQKKTEYTKISQNELAMSFYDKGFFNPQNVDQALMCLEMMDFDGKDQLMQKISQNGTMFQKLVQYMQLALQLASIAAPEMVPGLSKDIMSTMGVSGGMPSMAGIPNMSGEDNTKAGIDPRESTRVKNAREKSQNASQPSSGAVIRGRR